MILTDDGLYDVTDDRDDGRYDPFEPDNSIRIVKIRHEDDLLEYQLKNGKWVQVKIEPQKQPVF